VSADGDLLATGWNEVPAAGGGVYTQHYSNLGVLKDFLVDGLPSAVPDFRDHMLTGADGTPEPGDSNSRIRYLILSDLLKHLDELRALDNGRLRDLAAATAKGLEPETPAAWAAALLMEPTLKRATFNAMLEYGRSVHAEMNAITTAARLGLSLKGATLYSTTFPCHECARHIIATGIDRVIYIEPFPKSRVFELHADAVVNGNEIEGTAQTDGKVGFFAFIGISPWRHEELFSMVHRKKVDQQTVEQLPQDLWAVVDWSLHGREKLRPAFRIPASGPQVAESIPAWLIAVQAMQGAPDRAPA
jgi:deoxycytidylate deaminase